LDEKTLKIQDLTGQLTNLQIESNNKDNELKEKNKEIELLKSRAGLSREELLTEKLSSEKKDLDLFASRAKVSLEQAHSLSKYHERLYTAHKNFNQANIDVHEANIARIKQEFSEQEINIIDIQEICQKCKKIAELN